NTRKATTGGTYIVETTTGCPGYDSVVLTFNKKILPKFKGHLMTTSGVTNDTIQVGQNFALAAPTITINDTTNSVQLSWYKNNALYAVTIGHPGFSSYLIFIPKNTTGNDTFFVVVNKVNKIDTMCWVPDTSTSVIIYGVDGINDLYVHQLIQVYPNPTSGMITIEADRKMTQFTLQDLTGKEVFQTPINSTRFTTYLPVANGVYFYEVLSDRRVWRGKLVVER
ncbi:MAG: T9SS type A sorting domain-containing protein, partial [Bacteroidetes bacterium]|nr:T9SS type A sorting domain-containing protein [Bacteroidota bacterium]